MEQIDKVKYLFIPESEIPDYIMVGSISRMKHGDMLKYERKNLEMGDEIREFEQKIVGLLSQINEDDLDCTGIRCEHCSIHQNNIYMAARGFAKEFIYEHGADVIK